MMELSKTLQDEILKIQNEIKTAIQNHQILVLRQKVNQEDDAITLKLVEVQKHIRSLGESQKILLAKVRHELSLKKLKNNNNNHAIDDYSKFKSTNPKDRSLLKSNADHSNRSLLKYRPSADNERSSLLTNGDHNKPRSEDGKKVLLKNAEYTRSLLKSKSEVKDNHFSSSQSTEAIVHDSSSEENKTPCTSPNNLNDPLRRSIKRDSVEDGEWDLEDEEAVPSKRIKVTLQAAPRPSSPAEPLKSHKTSDSVSNSSEESVDNVFVSPYVESKDNFMGSLGLITNDSMLKLQNKKSERKRRKRKCNAPYRWYSGLWDLTVLQKRNPNKHISETRSFPTNELKKEDFNRNKDDDSTSGDSTTSKCKMCIICRKNGDTGFVECRLCPSVFHTSCSLDLRLGLCPSCCDMKDNAELAVVDSDCAPRLVKKADFTYAGKLKEKQQLLKKNASLKEDLSALENKAKNLSVSLVNQVTAVNQLSANEEKVRNSIKRVVDFVTAIQKSEIACPAVES